MSDGHPPCARGQSRRAVLGASIGLAPWFVGATRADDPSSIRPQPGDRFVYFVGEHKGQVVKIDDLPVGGPQVQAYPMDPKTGVVRDGSRLNLVILIRLNPTELSAETRPHAADGVVAYSGVCTHQGCPVNMWAREQGALFCSCHGSMYDPKNEAEVLAGPAPRRLPILTLVSEDGVPVVKAGFSAHVGPTQS